MSTIGRPPGTYQTGEVGANFVYWAKMAAWEISEGVALLVGINPDLIRGHRDWRTSVGAAAASRYRGVLKLAERSFEHGELPYAALPRQWLEWAKKKEIPIPEMLEGEVSRLYPDISLSADAARISVLEAKISRLRGEFAKTGPTTDQGVATRERESMLKLIVGMAIQGYRYDPKARRGEAIRDITNDLEKSGVALSDDTIRKYLVEAAPLLPIKENQDR